MAKNKLAVLVGGLGLLVAVLPAVAHHAFVAQYDPGKSTTLQGVVTKVEWTNPHARFYVDVKDTGGKVINWNLELASPNALKRLGWTRDILKVGDKVSAFVAPAKDGTKMANARTVTLADGRKMVAGIAAEQGGVQ
ncbi:MAG: hypothetical protein DMG32_00665 [Acidobacteria bacterium]|nr:MAG: hypothetical protein DMG32_00665 [Acidobacteriota bacterium]